MIKAIEIPKSPKGYKLKSIKMVLTYKEDKPPNEKEKRKPPHKLSKR